MRRRKDEVLLPPRGSIPNTGSDDPVDYYYAFGTGWLYRARLRLAGGLLGDGPFESLLDAGYGSGIFLPELARRADRVAGVDVHPHAGEVGRMLEALGVRADLRQSSVLELPFADESFDAVVSLSVLEHLRDLDGATSELRRVLRRGGTAVLGFPVRNPVTDLAFRVLGYRPREIHPSSQADILRAVQRHPGLRLDRVVRFPRFLPLPLAAYAACRALAV